MASPDIPRFIWPLTVDSTNRQIVIQEGASPAVTCSIATGTLWQSGDGTNGEDLVKEVSDALNDDPELTLTYTVSLSADGYYTISATGNFELLGTDAAFTAENFIGAPSSDTGQATSWTGTIHPDGAWWPTQPPSFDSYTETVYNTKSTPSESRVRRTHTISNWDERTISFGPVLRRYALTAYETVTREAFERFWTAVRDGTRFRYYPDRTDTATYATWVIRLEDWLRRRGVAVERDTTFKRLVYNINIPMEEYQA